MTGTILLHTGPLLKAGAFVLNNVFLQEKKRMGPLIALAPAAIQAITGAVQLFSGQRKKREAEANRPQYEIPREVQISTALARAQYQDPFMPGEGRMIDQNALAGANAVNAAINGGGNLSSVAAIQAQQQAGAQNIGIASAQNNRQNLAAYQGALGVLAGYRDQQFQINKFAPYAQKYNEGREQIGAGQSNLYGAADSLGRYAIAQAMMRGQPAEATPANLAASAVRDVQTTNAFNGGYDSQSYTPPDPAEAIRWWQQNSYKFLPKL